MTFINIVLNIATEMGFKTVEQCSVKYYLNQVN